MKRTWLLLMLCLVVAVHGGVVRAEEEDGHEHEEHWEYVGLFQANVSTKLSFTVRNTGEEDPSTFRAMFFITSSAGADEDSLEEAEHVSEEAMEAIEENEANTTAISGTYVTLGINRTYELSYSDESWVTVVTVVFPSDGYYVIFTDHHPEELCGVEDYNTCFRDQTGQMVDMLIEEGGDHDGHDHEEGHDESERPDGDRWLYSMVGCILVWLVVFSGLSMVVCGTRHYNHVTKEHMHLLNLFASGVILATVLLLIIVEAIHFIQSDSSLDEADVVAIFGVATLTGFLFPTLIDILMHRDKDVEVHAMEIISDTVLDELEKMNVATAKDNSKLGFDMQSQVKSTQSNSTEVATTTELVADLCNNEEDPTITQTSLRKGEIKKGTNATKLNSIVFSVLGGDFLHNFCDGVFIGVAAKSCSLTLLWTIIFVTMFHEFAQEISDFVILTNIVGLSLPRALSLNAVAGLSVVLGGIAVNTLNLNNVAIGFILAHGSGNLIYLSASELFPLLHNPANGSKKLVQRDKLLGLGCFCFGACVIGLTLLKHEHCENSEDGHDH